MRELRNPFAESSDVVRFTFRECMQACTDASLRQIESYFKNFEHTEGKSHRQYDFDNSVIGCVGELAVAKYMNLYWSGCQKVGASDVGHYEVKSTMHHHGELRIGKDWPNEDRYILCIVHIPFVRIAGWIDGDQAKKEEWFGAKQYNRKEMYWVPQEYLNPIETLVR